MTPNGSFKLAFSVALSAGLFAAPAFAATNITFWHAMGGKNGGILTSMVDKFNATHPDIHVTAVNKGSYRDALNATITAFRSGNAPDVVQVFDVGTQLATDAGIFEPVYKIMPPSFNPSDYLGPILGLYEVNGHLNSMPFNSSNPIMYYNKTLFAKAGLDPNKPPSTFEAVTQAAQKLVDSGTTASGIDWPLHGWLVEEWFADLDYNLVNNDNGRTGRATAAFLDSAAGKTIFNWWDDLAKRNLWVNPGVENWSQSDAIFVAGRTGMLITSTSDVRYLTEQLKAKGWDLGTAPLPVPAGTERHGVVVGGASLWVTQGHSDTVNQAIATFLQWMTSPAEQMYWSENTGYFPVVKGALTQMQQNGYYDANPNFAVAVKQMEDSMSTPAVKGAHLGPFLQVRTLVEQAVQRMLQDHNVDAAIAWGENQINAALSQYNQSLGG